MKEQWKPIIGYKGLYEVSNLGRVKSLPKFAGVSYRKEKILKPITNRDGYDMIQLHKNGITQNKQVHRLVAEAFINNPKNLPCVNHKNNIRNANFVFNLEWCDYSYNNKYAYSNGNRIKMFGSSNGKSVPILQLNLNGEIIKEFESMCICAKELNIQQSCISMVCNGLRKTTGGFIFRRKGEEDVK